MLVWNSRQSIQASTKFLGAWRFREICRVAGGEHREEKYDGTDQGRGSYGASDRMGQICEIVESTGRKLRTKNETKRGGSQMVSCFRSPIGRRRHPGVPLRLLPRMLPWRWKSSNDESIIVCRRVCIVYMIYYTTNNRVRRVWSM